MSINKDSVIEILKMVKDPELDIDIWTLGLVYKIDIKKNAIDIEMTFTSYACPYGPMLVEDVKHKLGHLKGIKEVKVEVVFNPPWQPNDEIKAMLGMI